jgi:hypothetical protein
LVAGLGRYLEFQHHPHCLNLLWGATLVEGSLLRRSES